MFFGFSKAVGVVGMRAIIVTDLNATISLVSANKELYFLSIVGGALARCLHTNCRPHLKFLLLLLLLKLEVLCI